MSLRMRRLPSFGALVLQLLKQTANPFLRFPRDLKDALRAASCLSKYEIDGRITTRCTPKGCTKKKKMLFMRNAESIAISCVKRNLLSRLGLNARADRSGTYSTSDLSAIANSNSHSSRRLHALIETGATKSVVGLRRAERITREVRENLQLSPSSR